MLTKFGAIITDGRGKVGSFYIGRNHYGTFLAEWTVPANPQTFLQQLRRSAQAFLSNNWQNLSDSQQREWIAETASYPKTNSIGNVYTLTGQTLYISLNLNLWQIGQGFIDAPVTKRVPGGLGTFTIAVDKVGVKFDITPVIPFVDAAAFYIVFATTGLSTGIFVVTTKYRAFDAITPDGSAAYDLGVDYWTAFPFTNIGDKVFCKIIPVDFNCGCAGVSFSTSAIVT